MTYRMPEADKSKKKMILLLTVLLAGTCIVSPITASLNEMDWDDVTPECCCGSALLPMACAGLRMRLSIMGFLSRLLGILPITDKPASTS